MSEYISAVTDETFDSEVLNSDKPVLVDYWAEWCGPCKAIAPVLDDIAPEYADKVKITKMNIDENPSIPSKFNVRSIPTLMLFKGGQVESTRMGALSKSQLTEFLDSAL